MKRIAIITPCILPVPATQGGAVEGLISKLIEDNERYRLYNIDLYTISVNCKCDESFLYTNFIYVETSQLSQILDRMLDKAYRTLNSASAIRLLDSAILKAFHDRLSDISGEYEAVIIENMMSTACAMVDLCNGRYDFPIYFHMHNDVDIYRSPEQIKKLVCNGVQFIAVSNYIKEQVLKCSNEAVVHVLYNGVDLEKYQRDAEKREEVSFLYAGRIIPDKGVKELVKAFNFFTDGLTSTDKKNCSLCIVGFSGFDKRYEKEVRSIAECNKQITLYDQIPNNNIVEKYASADVVVIPSKFEEPFGLVALESMAMGKTIIAADSGALPEVLGDTAIIVDKNQKYINNLCNAIKRVSADKDLRDQMAERAYKRARQIKAFDISVYYPGFCEIISGRKAEGKISVIVPVYNVEAYLSNCIESLIAQSYTNLEIILVNDGSTDSSEAICQEYAEKDPRIRIINQDNQGLSVARNTGLDNAIGDYIFFCDSDDSIRNDALEILMQKAASDNADVVACGIACTWYDSKGELDTCNAFTNSSSGRWSGRQAVVEMMRSNNICTVAWNKLYKKRLFDNVRFTVGVLHEDEAVTYKLLYKAHLVSYTPQLLYNYRQRSGSIMQNDISGRYHDIISALIDRRKFFEQNGENELAQHSQISLLEQIKYVYRNVSDVNEKEGLKRIYARELSDGGAPTVMGLKKKLALIAWRYIKY